MPFVPGDPAAPGGQAPWGLQVAETEHHAVAVCRHPAQGHPHSELIPDGTGNRIGIRTLQYRQQMDAGCSTHQGDLAKRTLHSIAPIAHCLRVLAAASQLDRRQFIDHHE